MIDIEYLSTYFSDNNIEVLLINETNYGIMVILVKNNVELGFAISSKDTDEIIDFVEREFNKWI